MSVEKAGGTLMVGMRKGLLLGLMRFHLLVRGSLMKKTGENLVHV